MRHSFGRSGRHCSAFSKAVISFAVLVTLLAIGSATARAGIVYRFVGSPATYELPDFSTVTSNLNGTFLASDNALVQGFISENDIVSAEFTATFDFTTLNFPVIATFGLPVDLEANIPIDPE